MSHIESVMQERRVFAPGADIVRDAAISGMEAYQALSAEARRDPNAFWSRLAMENVLWHKPFTRVLDESNAPFYRWFDS
jgi:acetyl-CoA synthetase